MTTVHAPVQRFHPTTGVLLGRTALVVAAVVAVLSAVSEPNLVGVRVVLGAALVSAVVWVVLLRPRATAYAETLVLHNQVSDTHLPLAAIDTVVVRHALNVWIGEERYLCAGIGRSSRSMLKRRSRGPMAVLGLEQTDDRMAMGQSALIGTSGDYATFVETRIADLAHAARRDGAGTHEVRRVWAVRELTALAVLTVAFAVSLLL